MHKNLNRSELIDASFKAQLYLKQVCGVLDSMIDVEESDNEESWRYCALLTLVELARKELAPAMLSDVKDPEVKP
ncbi:hypothetical protein [Pantoea stewartii]|uniref:hypothetical protein n=1 Tax=Pantoea stewartii TaxID=66269 RepID=UPI00162A4966|nr:hypothetical protein [Pantoea stewartii]MBC0852586.1 hypothetical protein [Pantoea stewartii]